MNSDQSSSNDHASETTASDRAASWTAGGIAAVILMAAFASILIQETYQPDDVFISDLPYEVLASEDPEPLDDAGFPLEEEGEPRPLQIHNTFYPKGIAVAANAEIELREWPPGYRFFRAEVGIDGAAVPGGPASVIFTVLADGTVLYESPVMRAGMPPRLIYVPIDDNRNSLTLRVTDAGDGQVADHAVWAMARFTAE